MKRLLATLAFAIAIAASGVAGAQVGPTTKQPSAEGPSAAHRLTVEFTTLRLMRDKGVISEAEYDSAMRDLTDSNGGLGGDSTTLLVGKWSTTLYGFVEADTIWDSTESLNDGAGNATIAKGNAYGGNNGRFTMSIRNSRIGFRIRAPEFHGVRASAMLEMDFFGNQNPIGYTPGNSQQYPGNTSGIQISENAYFTNPAFRARHINLKLETPIVDILFGQYWELFGWQSVYHPNTVEIQGVPGQIYSRTPQIRISKTIKTDAITFEAAVAMMRAPQRDSWSPEGQGGLRLAVNKWTGVQTAGSTGTGISPLSFAVTADVRQFNAPPFSGKATDPTVGATGWGVAGDAYIPIVPGRKGHKRNSLSVNGEYGYGQGISDLYTGLSASAWGVTNPAPPNPMKLSPAPAFSPNIDPAMAVYGTDGTLHLINVQSYLVGVQYYFPVGDGRLWISGNYSNTSSNNAMNHKASAMAVGRQSLDWADGNLFFDVTPAVRLGLEYAWFRDNFTDGHFSVNHRAQLSAFYIF